MRLKSAAGRGMPVHPRPVQLQARLPERLILNMIDMTIQRRQMTARMAMPMAAMLAGRMGRKDRQICPCRAFRRKHRNSSGSSKRS